MNTYDRIWIYDRKHGIQCESVKEATILRQFGKFGCTDAFGIRDRRDRRDLHPTVRDQS